MAQTNLSYGSNSVARHRSPLPATQRTSTFPTISWKHHPLTRSQLQATPRIRNGSMRPDHRTWGHRTDQSPRRRPWLREWTCRALWLAPWKFQARLTHGFVQGIPQRSWSVHLDESQPKSWASRSAVVRTQNRGLNSHLKWQHEVSIALTHGRSITCLSPRSRHCRKASGQRAQQHLESDCNVLQQPLLPRFLRRLVPFLNSRFNRVLEPLIYCWSTKEPWLWWSNLCQWRLYCWAALHTFSSITTVSSTGTIQSSLDVRWSGAEAWVSSVLALRGTWRSLPLLGSIGRTESKLRLDCLLPSFGVLISPCALSWLWLLSSDSQVLTFSFGDEVCFE